MNCEVLIDPLSSIAKQTLAGGQILLVIADTAVVRKRMTANGVVRDPVVIVFFFFVSDSEFEVMPCCAICLHYTQVMSWSVRCLEDAP